MLNIDLKGRRALVAGVADDGGFGFAIAKALAEAGASVCVGTWPPALNIFLNLLERGKMDESRRLSSGALLTFEKIYPLDAVYDTYDEMPEDVRRAYYHLAKEIHPDRFLAPPLDVLHARMEELFAQVLEAYNTLVSPEARARYDTERAQAGGGPKITTSDQQMLAKQNFARGKMLVDENKPAEALKWLQNAVDIEPNKPQYQRLLALVLAKNPRLRGEAELHFIKAIQLDPARADNYLQLGLLYKKLGDVDKAITRLRECLKWDPANGEAGTALAELTAAPRR